MFSDERAGQLLNEILDVVCPAFRDAMTGFQSTGRWPDGKDSPVFEVRVFPALVELLGGKHDGETVYHGFRVDLEALHEAVSEIYDEIEEWEFDNAVNIMDDLPRPCISIAGKLKGTAEDILIIRICPEPPEDAQPMEKHVTG
ncbi:MAG TPA: hypothetical protein DCX07_07235 [Phycisphaerales bacterium]|nr:hypothetical protein [Phycisphaerales bacterium]